MVNSPEEKGFKLKPGREQERDWHVEAQSKEELDTQKG